MKYEVVYFDSGIVMLVINTLSVTPKVLSPDSHWYLIDGEVLRIPEGDLILSDEYITSHRVDKHQVTYFFIPLKLMQLPY